MSYRKTKLIQERNLLLERKYILEQAPPPPPPVPAPAGGTPTPPPPAGGTTTPPPPAGGTTTQGPTKPDVDINKIKDAINKEKFCAKYKLDDTMKNTKSVEPINMGGTEYFYYLTTTKEIFCVDKKT